ncbi:MAG: hypothetical protein KatS3mg131_1961 [Candidatus Tectimicrobiota bacterium]|nr:MAG: hypothetical protein KatS3mg131_1961 [Candidatus Tectomicrobia bacterium]
MWHARTRRLLGASGVVLALLVSLASAQEGFSQKDRELLHELAVRVGELDKRLGELRQDVNQRFNELRQDVNQRLEQVDKRFAQVDQRFNELRQDVNLRLEQVDQRFAQVDKRFNELRQDMNQRFAQVDQRFAQVDKRFAQIDKRFDELRQDMNQRFAQIDKRFEQLTQFLYILSGIFTALVAVVIGFAYWDRRTIIREARREAIEWMEKEGTLRRVVEALREVAREDARMAEALRRTHIL